MWRFIEQGAVIAEEPALDVQFGRMLPRIISPPPGPKSRKFARRLARVESQNVTCLTGKTPPLWEAAKAANVRDVDGNVFVDLTAAFGVALLGHGEPSVVRRIEEQSRALLHGMGDVHPSRARVELLEALADIAPWSRTRAVLASSGSEAVEIALKTAEPARGRSGILAFASAYHGRTLGALSTTQRPPFRHPFGRRLYDGVAFAPFPTGSPNRIRNGSFTGTRRATLADAGPALQEVEGILRRGAPNGDPIGAVVVEPVQGRGGVRIPASGFMAGLSQLARDAGALVIADEIFTGLGRCGRILASERVGLEPDIVCLGKVLGGGMPISACVGRKEMMDAWPPSEGEAIHTSTFLGHPAGCAAATQVIKTLVTEEIPTRADELGARMRSLLADAVGGSRAARWGTSGQPEAGYGVELRGLGLMIGIDLGRDGAGVKLADSALREGFIVLPAGSRGEVVQLSPPVCLTNSQMETACATIGRLSRRCASK